MKRASKEANPPLGSKLIPVLLGRRWRTSDGRFLVRKDEDRWFVIEDTAPLVRREIARTPSFAQAERLLGRYYQ